MRGDGIGQPVGIFDTGDRTQHLARDLLVQLDVLVEGIQQRAHQPLHFLGSPLVRRQFQRRHLGDETGLGFGEPVDAHAVVALHQYLDRAVRQSQQLQHVRQSADGVQIAGSRVVHLGAALRDQDDALVLLHRQVERVDRFLPTDEQRDHHVRIDDDVAEWQNRH